MGWFPTTRGSSEAGWRFDIISLLAVVGGSTIEKHAQAITASPFAAFPRLLPAPETLLNTERPVRLPSVKDVNVIGVFSGVHLTELNYFADIIHDIRSLEDYEFRVYHIKYANKNRTNMSTDVEKDRKNAKDSDNKIVTVPVRTFCPLNVVTLISILMTVGLFVWAAVIHDGVALLGIVTMSLSTSAAGLSSQWHPSLATRRATAVVPKGDVVIKTRGGAFVVVHGDEDVMRELYGGKETCRYVCHGGLHQALLASSTVLLMASILLFSNCGWTMQLAIGVAYIILNILYWAMSLLTEPKQTWDMSKYEVLPAKYPATSAERTYTEVLWRAIQETKEIAWVERSDPLAKTRAWQQWLREAKANCDNENWDPVEAIARCLREAEEEKTEERKTMDQAITSIQAAN